MRDGPSLAIVVERDDSLRERVVALLKAARVERIECAPLPAQGAKLLPESAGADVPFGVLVTGLEGDLRAPRALIGRCRARHPNWVILALDHRDDSDSAAEALAAGADDVLRVPFPPREFEARLQLRQRQAAQATGRAEESPVPMLAKARLTPVETEIMMLLLSRRGEIVTRNELSQHIDNSDWTYGDRKFDVHVAKIRKKLRAGFGDRYTLRTVRSVGYCLQECAGVDTVAR
ncbi:MAG: winged helix-turn-helix domain-containing protein [Paracoccaceae bacterium]